MLRQVIRPEKSAIKFDGVAGYVMRTGEGFGMSHHRTYLFGFSVNNVQDGSWDCIFQDGDVGTSERVVALVMSETLRVGWYNGSSYIVKTVEVKAGKEYYCAMVQRGDEIDLVVNEKIATDTSGSPVADSTGAVLGARANGDRPLNGKVFHFSAWDIEFTRSQMFEFTLGNKTPKTSDAVAYIDINRVADDYILDKVTGAMYPTTDADNNMVRRPNRGRPLRDLQNLIYNGDFQIESADTSLVSNNGWYAGVDTNTARENAVGWYLANGGAGAKGIAINKNGAYGEFVEDTYIQLRSNFSTVTNTDENRRIKVKPGKKYRLRYEQKLELDNDATTSTANGAFAQILFSKKDKVTGAGSTPSEKIRESHDWKTVELEVTAPDEAAFANIELRVYAHQGDDQLAGRVWWRNVELVELP